MKRYLVFGGESYYPSGGMRDLMGQHDDEADARAEADAYVSQHRERWAHVVDLESGDVVIKRRVES